MYTGRKVVNPGTGKLEDEKVYVGGFQEGMEYGILVVYQAEGIYRSVDDIPGNLVVTSGNIQGKYQYGPEAWNSLSSLLWQRYINADCYCHVIGRMLYLCLSKKRLKCFNGNMQA